MNISKKKYIDKSKYIIIT